jgi:hypothetical protein
VLEGLPLCLGYGIGVVLLLLSWVHELMLQRQTAGGLRMPAPILARVHTVSVRL